MISRFHLRLLIAITIIVSFFSIGISQEQDLWIVQTIPFKEFKQALGKYRVPRFCRANPKLISYEVESEKGTKLFIGDLHDSSSYEINIVQHDETGSGSSFSSSETVTSLVRSGDVDWCPTEKNGTFWFAFVSSGDASSNNDIYIGNVKDTLHYYHVTSNKSADFRPRWSPDGKSISFISSRTGALDIYLIRDVWGMIGRMNDTVRQTNRQVPIELIDNGFWLDRLTDSPTEDNWQSWSHDGKYIVYGVLRNFSEFDSYNSIALIDIHKNESTTLIKDHKRVLRNPTLSYDGAYLAYYSEGSPNDLSVNLVVGNISHSKSATTKFETFWTSKNVRKFKNVNSDVDRGPAWGENGSLLFVNGVRGWPYSVYEIPGKSFQTSGPPNIIEHKIVKAVNDPMLFLQDLEVGTTLASGNDFMVSAIMGKEFGSYTGGWAKSEGSNIPNIVLMTTISVATIVGLFFLFR